MPESDESHPFCPDRNGYVIDSGAGNELTEVIKDPSVAPKAQELLRHLAHERDWTFVIDNAYTDTEFVKRPCAFRAMVTMNGPEGRDGLVQAWTNHTRRLRECINPDLDLVLPSNVDNRLYLQRVLAAKFDNYDICHDKFRGIFIIALVNTPPEAGETRKAIRSTWCKQRIILGMFIRCVFVMGVSRHDSQKMRDRLRQEFVQYGDIVQGNFVDSYKNLTLKLILGLKWVTKYCSHATYVYKGDADVFVNFRNIVSLLVSLRNRNESLDKFYIGLLQSASIRFSPSIPEHRLYSRYHVPDTMYYGRFYPPYCSGGSYVISADVVPQLIQEALTTVIINIEDAFVGILAKKIGVTPVDHQGFRNYGGKHDVCSLRNAMTVHGVGKSELIKLWRVYTDKNVVCKFNFS
ncbi:beta-1,3-galactosyltransferase 1-like [Diadema setosum]|uniref:beta-1,3-galactosyltransferase 1-like n=1 Tax=Diadema setosum TaxID=31175 RepID=UPI003B3A1F89